MAGGYCDAGRGVAFSAGSRRILNILCEDWRFYRDKILKATAAGDVAAADDARRSFQRTNVSLDAYPENDVAAACGPR
jgi:hypothetical protein